MSMLTSALREQLTDSAENADRGADWPITSWEIVRQVGMLGRSIPREFGGAGLPPVELQQGMEELASCCLTTAFIQSQREAAVRHLLRGPHHLREQYLPGLAAGTTFLTVGLSQLTTSRQHLGPALSAVPQASGEYRLNGEIPWVTGADQADAIVAGATLSDGRQLLVVISAERLREMIDSPLPLAALVGSRTSLIHCRDVLVDADAVLAGPTPNVLGQLGGGGLDTSCLAIGLASAATDFIQGESVNRPELVPIAEKYRTAVTINRARLHELAQSTPEPQQTLALRLECTKLALRASQASLMVAKGNGFVAPHPAQRWARQATFFLVWSCPRPVAEGVLADLADW